MKVLLINGSPHEHGCTRVALDEAARVLHECGVETELINAGRGQGGGCIACGACRKTGKCVRGGGVNEAVEALKAADGLIVGSPVHYASPAGELLAFLDRMFYSGAANFAHKPAACIVSARRAGTTASVDVINKYFTISQMPVVSSTYWPMVHGATPEDVEQDAEGLQTVRNLARNMAWLIKCIHAAGIEPPQAERSARTNFVR